MSLVGGMVAVVAALPWALGTGPARHWLLGKANRVLAPASLDVSTIRLSWVRSTHLTGFVLRDAQGDRVIESPVATWDRNLWQILFQRPRLGTFDLDRAALDIERRADGTVDLYEAIRPVVSKNPRTDLHVRVHRGRLRFRTAGQPVPVTAERADLVLVIPPAPRPLTVRLLLENPETARPASLQIQAEYDRWGTPTRGFNDLVIDVKGQRWPWALRVRDLETSGRLEGGFRVSQRSGNWSASGEAGLADLDASGSLLAGDHLRLDRVGGTWNVSETAGAWTVHRLDLMSPVGWLKASGELDAARPVAGRIEGNLDLAGLARQLPHALHLREGIVLDRGTAGVRLESRIDAGSQVWDVEAKVSDLQARDHDRAFTLHDPATLSARIARRTEGLAVRQIAVQTAFLKATGQGDLERGLAWSGTLDLGGFQRQLRDLVDFGDVDLAGHGEVAGHYRRAGADFRGQLTADLRDLRVGGLAPGTIRRDAVHLSVALDGPAADSGLPRGWTSGRLALTSGAVSADLSATSSRRGANTLTLALKGPIGSTDPPRQGEGRLEAHWDGSALSIDRLRLAVQGSGAEAQGEPVVLEARGRYDRQRGELALAPAGPPGPREIALAPEGVRVQGIGRPGELRISAGLGGDLEALARLAWQEEGEPTGRVTGTWTSNLAAESTEDGLRLAGKVQLRPLVPAPGDAPRGRSAEPIGLACSALYRSGADRLDIAELVVSSRYLNLEGSGRLSELSGRCLAELRGTLTPDWKAIDAFLAERVEPRAHVSGKARAWRLAGPLAGETTSDRLRSLEGEFGFELAGADIYGLHVGPAPIVVRTREGRLVLDTIDTSLNGGRMHLEPELTTDPQLGLTLRLGASSSIANAEINDEVSRRFLSYVAPVLDQATRAHGRVSVDLEEAVFPLGGTAQSRRSATVNGRVVFQEVEFVPGPFANELFDLIGVTDRPGLRLDEPVALTIADRRVYQHGMAIPLGRLTRIELEGWVDFDRNIRLVASLPITPAMVGNAPVLSDIVKGQRISVPIRGTMRAPQIDRDAMNLALKDLGKSILENGAVRGAAELLMRLRPRLDPNAPPPLTREQRKSRRLERRAERRFGPGLEP